MSRPRISILWLIASVVVCGVVFAALRSGSDYWRSAFYTMTVGLLLGAVVAARYRRGTSRAFWFGFAVFGWGGFLLTSNPWRSMGVSMIDGFGGPLNQNMLTTRVIQYLVVRLRMGTEDMDKIDQITSNTIGIVCLLLVLAIGTGGGLFAVFMKQRARRGTVANSSQRSNVGPSLVILVGLGFAGLGTLDRQAPPYFVDIPTNPDEFGTRFHDERYSEVLWAAGEPSLSLLASEDRTATV